MIEKMWNTNRKADILVVVVVVFSAIIAETNANQTSQTNETILNHAINYSDIQTRIVGGSNVASGQGTFVVRLVFRPAGECTGAIIGRRYILTAGHCVNGKTGGVIYGGTVSRDDPNPIVTQMSRLLKHPQYGTTYGGYDVGIIEVARDLDLSGRQTSVVLTSSVINFNHGGFQFGWSQCKNSAMRNLQKLSVGFLNTADCKRHGGHEHQYPEMICVDPGSTAKICPGDSGGPIISSGKVVGILSGAHDILGVPMYAQNVYHYLVWIKSVIGN